MSFFENLGRRVDNLINQARRGFNRNALANSLESLGENFNSGIRYVSNAIRSETPQPRQIPRARDMEEPIIIDGDFSTNNIDEVLNIVRQYTRRFNENDFISINFRRRRINGRYSNIIPRHKQRDVNINTMENWFDEIVIPWAESFHSQNIDAETDTPIPFERILIRPL